MTKKSTTIDIDLAFDGLELDERQIKKDTGYMKAARSRTGQKRSPEQKQNMSAWQKGKPKNDEHKEKIGDAFRGKTLEEILGEERAKKGKEARRQTHLGKKRTKETIDKAVATRRANDSYGKSMLGKEHKDSTKSTMSLKAEIRQDLKRQLGLGRNDKVPTDLLQKAYKKHGLL